MDSNRALDGFSMSVIPPPRDSQTAIDREDDERLDPRHVPLGPTTGVRRVNSLPLLIISVGLVTFCLLIALALLDRAGNSRRTVEAAQSPTAPHANGTRTAGVPSVLSQAPAGIIEAQTMDPQASPALNGPLDATTPAARTAPGPTPALGIAQDRNLPQVPAPAGPAPARPLPDPALEHERAMRALEERMNAFAERAKATSVMPFRTEQPIGNLPTIATASQDDIATRLAEIRRTLEQTPVDAPAASTRPRPSGSDVLAPMHAGPGLATTATETRVEATGPDTSAGSPGTDRWHLAARWDRPRSPYELRAGSVIPALALTAIRSELPGQVMAQVASDVYDTATGQHRVIPQGTRLIGRYASDVMYGQKTLFVAWQRMVRPDGAALDLGSMPAAQASGATGLSDEVDNHYLRLFGSALLLSGVTAGITYSTTPSQSTNASAATQPSGRETLSEALGQQLGQVTAQLLVKNMNVSPTLEIRPGYRFVVLVTKDIDFTPPNQADTHRR